MEGNFSFGLVPTSIAEVCKLYDDIQDQLTRFDILRDEVGDKDAAKRADDLLDAFVYAVSLCWGNAEGF
jgi:hypothetical protein